MSTSGFKKPFNQAVFNQFDERDRKAVAAYFAEVTGMLILRNHQKFGADLVVYDPLDYEPICLIECETKRGWKGAAYPFDNLRYAARKSKYTEGHDLPIWHVTVNAEGTHAAWVSEDLNTFPVEVSDTYMSDSESFFQVPLSAVTFVQLKDSKNTSS